MKKTRIKEIPIEIDGFHDSFSNPSLIVVNKYLKQEKTFFDQLTNDFWNEIVVELFSTCIVNLLISKKIKVEYCKDRTSLFFNLIKIDSEGYNLTVIDNQQTDIKYDFLSNDILEAISKKRYKSLNNYPKSIDYVVNKYIDLKTNSKAEMKFFYEYIKLYSLNFNWLNLNKKKKLLGLISDFEIEVDENIKLELLEFQKKFDFIKFNLRKDNLLFRNFLKYTENIVSQNFRRRNHSD